MHRIKGERIDKSMDNKLEADTLRYRRDEVSEVAQLLLEYFSDKCVWAFDAPMGGGKTTLINALCEALEIEEVTSSPTFAIVNEYHSTRKGSVYHMDCYRLDTLADAYRIGLNEYIDSNCYCFVEWAGVLRQLLPTDALLIRIAPVEGAEDERLLTVLSTDDPFLYDVK